MTKKSCGIALLDRYIISQFIPSFLFSLVICTIFSELIGISFEQIKFATTENLPIEIVGWIHYYKLPAFIVLSLPLSLLMATIITYSNLAANKEIIALQSLGIKLYRIVSPVIAIALIVTILMFALQEMVVPVANYQAAIILETEWGVDRNQLAKYRKRDIVYQKFSSDSVKPTLEFLFFAEHFDGQKMQEITLLQYHQHRLQKIIIAQLGKWNETKQLWQFFLGKQYIIAENGFYAEVENFQLLPIKITKDILNYANHHRDLREMNLRQLYRRRNLIAQTNDRQTLQQISTAIQERFAFPFSCLVFTGLGTTLGIITNKNRNSNSLGVAAIAILIYYAIQFIATIFTTIEATPAVYAVWLPNAIGLCLIGYLLEY